ncbi:ABC transporter substrate-binding protein [Nocardioides insulae]|uniref:ABC transporter substrate-binding protein n=1 Tax=Nocardioides insulae TaxID=394734 RepID=UPI0003FF44A1|nr:ABC transporter substrate-binding protein [Nocardioides insulae]
MPRLHLIRPMVGLVAVGLAVAACSGGETSEEAATGSDQYPVTVENCGAEVTFDAEPERVVMLKSAAVPFLHDLGVMDRVVARAGAYPDAYYDEETLAELDEIPTLTDELDSSGHLQISKEIVIAQEPDLVLGEVENLSRETLGAVDIPLIEEPALCSEGGDTDPSFEDIYSQMDLYGTVFDKADAADQANSDLEKRVEEITAEAEQDVAGQGERTAAVLYPTVGGGTTYAYGNQSMADPQLEAAGFTNVFGDTDERVFEVTLEELLGRDPDVIVLLYSEGDPQKVEEALTSLPGAEQLTAVKDDELLPMLFNFTEPATPLTVDGLETIVDRFDTPEGDSGGDSGGDGS